LNFHKITLIICAATWLRWSCHAQWRRDCRHAFFSLSAEPVTAEREKLLAIPTNLQLPADDVQRLRNYGANTLRKHPAFVLLLQDLTAAAATSSASP
jgi:hypothetical protein